MIRWTDSNQAHIRMLRVSHGSHVVSVTISRGFPSYLLTANTPKNASQHDPHVLPRNLRQGFDSDSERMLSVVERTHPWLSAFRLNLHHQIERAWSYLGSWH